MAKMAQTTEICASIGQNHHTYGKQKQHTTSKIDKDASKIFIPRHAHSGHFHFNRYAHLSPSLTNVLQRSSFRES